MKVASLSLSICYNPLKLNKNGRIFNENFLCEAWGYFLTHKKNAWEIMIILQYDWECTTCGDPNW